MSFMVVPVPGTRYGTTTVDLRTMVPVPYLPGTTVLRTWYQQGTVLPGTSMIGTWYQVAVLVVMVPGTTSSATTP